MKRLDVELVDRGLCDSRNKAQIMIRNKYVTVNGRVIDKSSFLVDENDNISLESELKYVSKGGYKLDFALKKFDVSLKGKKYVDIGSSTGGFIDCLLQNGVKEVVGIDVGLNQLSPKLKGNKQIRLYEGTDFRDFDLSLIRDFNGATVDISFISVTKIIDKLRESNIDDIIVLIKPQFECGKDIADFYRGVILDKKVHYDILVNMIKEFEEKGFYLSNITYSPIRGGSGNIEYLGEFQRVRKNKTNSNLNKVINEAFNKSKHF